MDIAFGAEEIDQRDLLFQQVARLEPWIYFGDYSLRGKGERGLATAFASGSE